MNHGPQTCHAECAKFCFPDVVGAELPALGGRIRGTRHGERPAKDLSKKYVVSVLPSLVGMVTVCGCCRICICGCTRLFGRTWRTCHAGFNHRICKRVGGNTSCGNWHRSLCQMGMGVRTKKSCLLVGMMARGPAWLAELRTCSRVKDEGPDAAIMPSILVSMVSKTGLKRCYG